MTHHPVSQFFVLGAFAAGIFRDKLWPADKSLSCSWCVCFAFMIAAALTEAR